MTDVVGYTRRHVTYAPNLARRRREGNIPQNHPLKLLFGFVGELVSAGAEDLQTVIFARIVRRRNHHAGVRAQPHGQVSERGGGHNARQKCVGAAGAQSGGQRCFEHVAGKAGVLADYNFRFAVFGGTQHLGERKPEPVRAICGQLFARDAAYAVSAE